MSAVRRLSGDFLTPELFIRSEVDGFRHTSRSPEFHSSARLPSFKPVAYSSYIPIEKSIPRTVQASTCKHSDGNGSGFSSNSTSISPQGSTSKLNLRPFSPRVSHHIRRTNPEQCLILGDQEEKKRRSPSSSHLKKTFQGLVLAEKLPPMSDAQIARYKIELPPRLKVKTVIFDLDETLVHRVEDLSQAEAVVPVTCPNGSILMVGFNIRPCAVSCLRDLSSSWEVLVFTASQKCYADAVLDYLDPTRTVISHRFYREHCIKVGAVALKDLRMLQGRNMADTVIIDDSVCNFAFQLDNGIPIRSWTSDKRDTELVKLVGFLKRLRLEPDVRTLLRRTFNLRSFTSDYLKATNSTRA